MNDNITLDIKADEAVRGIHVRVNLVGVNVARLRIKLGTWLVRLGLFIAGVDYEVTSDN